MRNVANRIAQVGTAVNQPGPRLPSIPPEELDADRRRLYDHLTSANTLSGRSPFQIRNSEGSLLGPFRAFLVCPELGWAVHGLGEALLASDRLPVKLREAAILTVAGMRSAAYMQYAHEPVARAAGITEALIAALRTGRPARCPDDQAVDLVITAACELLSKGGLGTRTYQHAVTILGDEDLVHLVLLIGFYNLIAGLLNTFQLGPPEKRPTPQAVEAHQKSK